MPLRVCSSYKNASEIKLVPIILSRGEYSKLASIAYLNMTKPWQINLTKKILIDFSYKAQHIAAKLSKPFEQHNPH
jgi:hypothetical protein